MKCLTNRQFLFNRRIRSVGMALVAGVLFSALPAVTEAQEESGVEEGPTIQPTPFSAWIDLQKFLESDESLPAFPIWMESLQIDTKNNTEGVPQKTIYRIRLRKMEFLHDSFLLRVFFNDKESPVVTAWSELGDELFRSPALGQQLGLQTSESVVIPAQSVDYIEIETGGDGATLRGVFVNSLKNVSTHEIIDFSTAAAPVDPFSGSKIALPQTLPGTSDKEEENKTHEESVDAQVSQNKKDQPADTSLYGRVNASLSKDPIKLTPFDSPEALFEFELATQPLIAMVTFEILDMDASAPPTIIVNNLPIGDAAIQYPDLADPGYQGMARGLESGMRFHYTGWLKGQKILPGSFLTGGWNKVAIELHSSSGPVAIRNVDVQLKYNWKHLDYTLNPIEYEKEPTP